MYNRSFWYIGGPTYSSKLSAEMRTWTELGTSSALRTPLVVLRSSDAGAGTSSPSCFSTVPSMMGTTGSAAPMASDTETAGVVGGTISTASSARRGSSPMSWTILRAALR